MVDRGFLNGSKNWAFVDSRILENAPIQTSRDLPVDFVPGSWDVICSRGAKSYNHGEFPIS
jgi:hypothetical protein